MQHPTSLTDPDKIIVADTSAAINLNASGFAEKVLQAIPNKVVIPDSVLAELDAGRKHGYNDTSCFRKLINDGLVGVISLGKIAVHHFENLVIGPATETLDDGEAATIACAVEQLGIAILDERKANGICAKSYPDLLTGCTVDFFSHPEVYRILGKDNLALSVFNALTIARMRVLPHHQDWVVQLIGPEQAMQCNSLPKAIRQFNTSTKRS